VQQLKAEINISRRCCGEFQASLGRVRIIPNPFQFKSSRIVGDAESQSSREFLSSQV